MKPTNEELRKEIEKLLDRNMTITALSVENRLKGRQETINEFESFIKELTKRGYDEATIAVFWEKLQEMKNK